MNDVGLIQWVLLPIGFGLMGFFEPCSVGSTLMFIQTVEGKRPEDRVAQVVIFALTRALFMGALGLGAIVIGSVFLGFQKTVWMVFGAFFMLIGFLYLAGKSDLLTVRLGPRITQLSGARSAVVLGVLFAFNIPACAGPLLIALLGMAAASGASGSSIALGFTSMALFGLALSLPIVVVVLFPRARSALDWVVALSRRMPRRTGLLFVALGIWSIWFGLFVSVA
jgi:cytochrome c-type biogenesis protein